MTLEETKTSTRVLLVSAIVLVVVLITGPLGYKLGMVPLQPSIFSLPIAAAGSLLVLIAGIVFMVMAVRAGRTQDRNQVGIAMVIALIPVAIVGPQIGAATSVPPIHNISTDLDNPPEFVAILPLRKEAPNGVSYGSEQMSADDLAEQTRTSYPDLKPMMSSLGVAEAVSRSEAALLEMGLEIVSVNSDSGLVEATATTFWFGFKDDVVVRVTPADDGSRIDVRSMSRLGQSDLGANAARIQTFFDTF